MTKIFKLFLLKNFFSPNTLNIVFGVLFLPLLGFCLDFPDKDGIPDFSKPQEISDQLFILTNPKSGSHLLLYSIMKITKRPLRGRLPLWHFENEPHFFNPENLMGYPIDFSKPTTYWGHEYTLLSKLNKKRNKLIFILRNYKETISSQLVFKHKGMEIDLDNLFLKEIINY